jgi:hypothetical protein
LDELDAPQSEIDWVAAMFSHGLDVVDPGTVIENLHFSKLR